MTGEIKKSCFARSGRAAISPFFDALMILMTVFVLGSCGSPKEGGIRRVDRGIGPGAQKPISKINQLAGEQIYDELRSLGRLIDWALAPAKNINLQPCQQLTEKPNSYEITWHDCKIEDNKDIRINGTEIFQTVTAISPTINIASQQQILVNSTLTITSPQKGGDDITNIRSFKLTPFIEAGSASVYFYLREFRFTTPSTSTELTLKGGALGQLVESEVDQVLLQQPAEFIFTYLEPADNNSKVISKHEWTVVLESLLNWRKLLYKPIVRLTYTYSQNNIRRTQGKWAFSDKN